MTGRVVDFALAAVERGPGAVEARNRWLRGLVVPHRITLALDIRKLDGPEVDEACGVEEPTVDLWECGRVYPTWEQLLKLAVLTGFDVAFFTAPLAAEPLMVINLHRPVHPSGFPHESVFEAVRQERPVPAFTQAAIRRTLSGRPGPAPGRRA